MSLSQRRSDDPSDQRNWALDCQICDLRFLAGTIADVAEHWNAEHPDQEADKPHLQRPPIAQAPKMWLH